MNKKNMNKAFTLIELMIVVVILWILMSTVLPKLTWAQARARDTARIADLSNISAALWVYYDDYWEYPWTNTWDQYCLSESWWVASDIKDYMQNSVVPQDPQSSSSFSLCWWTEWINSWHWKYFYSPLTKKTLAKNSYILCADVETYQKANVNFRLITTAPTAAPVPAVPTTTVNAIIWNDYDDFEWRLTNHLTEEADNASGDPTAWFSIYCILRP